MQPDSLDDERPSPMRALHMRAPIKHRASFFSKSYRIHAHLVRCNGVEYQNFCIAQQEDCALGSRCCEPSSSAPILSSPQDSAPHRICTLHASNHAVDRTIFDCNCVLGMAADHVCPF